MRPRQRSRSCGARTAGSRRVSRNDDSLARRWPVVFARVRRLDPGACAWDLGGAEPEPGALFVQLCDEAGQRYLEDDQPANALTIAERGLLLDELNEHLARVAMTAESRIGLRTHIAARYDELRSKLNERLGLEPEQATRTLYRLLLAQT